LGRISFDYCGLDDAEALMRFVHDHWSPNHILSRSRRLLDWQHRNEAEARYNILLARTADGEIVGMLGFIPSSRYDSSLAADRETIWLSVWRALDGYAAGLGLLLLRELDRRLAPKWIGTVGINEQVRGIYAAMGYRTGELIRSYRLNGRIADRRLIGGRAEAPPPPAAERRVELRRLNETDFAGAAREIGLEDCGQQPAKTPELFRNRYLRHPFYEYQIYLAQGGGRSALIVMRPCHHAGATALRWVDFLGDQALLGSIGPAVDALLHDQQAEYVDHYHAGDLPELRQSGFAVLDAAGPLILPAYFEPFECSNVRILYAMKGVTGGLSLAKGDADQDRPNQLHGD
jgi:hypothetical protein